MLLRVGTRGSALALWQTNWVIAQLRSLRPDIEVETVTMKTQGDRQLDVPLSVIGGKGVFVSEIENALLRGDVDLAVHSLKDMPSEQPDGLTIAAVPPREDPRDALVSRLGLPLHSLPAGARVGTSSLRRQAQLLAARPDLVVENLRGNLDTRLRKSDSDFEAIILAVAGLHRLGLEERIVEILAPEICTPAVGQGALAIEARSDDSPTRDLLAQLDDPVTRQAVAAERAFLGALGGGCAVPLGAYALSVGDQLTVQAVVAHPSGIPCLRRTLSGPAADAPSLGRQLAKLLLADGAGSLLSGF
ncbi:MAG: hydroxymethylbilane synthase [Chloroflexota bacterium]